MRSIEQSPRSWRQPIEASRRERYVYTDAELRLAIGDAMEAAGATAANVGTRIVIAAPLQVSRQVVLPAECPGLIVEGNSFTPIAVTETIAGGLFSLNASRQSVRGLFVSGATTFVDVDTAAEDILIVGNTASGCTTFVTGAMTNSVIAGNVCGGGAIDTSGGSGGNRLAGNADVGARTRHADDLDDDAYNDPGVVTIASAASITLDFSPKQSVLRDIDLAHDPTFATSNLVAGRSLSVRIDAGASSRTLTWPAWIVLNDDLPTTLNAGETLVVSLVSWGTTDGDVVAGWGIEV